MGSKKSFNNQHQTNQQTSFRHTLSLAAVLEISSLRFIDGSLIYPLRHSHRYPRNQICSARGTFHSQKLYKPNLYKWASFVHRMQLLNLLESTNAPRWKWTHTHTHNHTWTVSGCLLFFKIKFRAFVLAHACSRARKGHIWSAAWGRWRWFVDGCGEGLHSLLKKRLTHASGGYS